MVARPKAILSNLNYENFSWTAFNAILLISVFVSSMLVVYFKHQSRQLFSQVQQLQHQEQQLSTEWSQLLLEQGTWGSDIRVEKVAREKLSMYLPEPNEVKIIRQ